MEKNLKIEEKLKITEKLFLAISHVLIMNAYVVPIVIAKGANFSSDFTNLLIRQTLIISGIATFIQAKFFMKYPVVYGASFIPMGAIAGIAQSYGSDLSFSYVLGGMLVGSILFLIIGFSSVLKRIIDYFIPPFVAGLVVLIIGLSLIPIALHGQIFIEDTYTMPQNILLAFVTFISMIVFMILSQKKGKLGAFFSVFGALFAIIAGVVFSYVFHSLDFDALKNYSIISTPKLAFVNFPIKFDFNVIITMIIIYMVLVVENTGSWIATEDAVGDKLSESTLNRAIIGSGVSNLLSALLISSPISAFSSNAGMLTVTKKYSRHIFSYVGIILIIIGLSGKLSALITIIPASVIGGLFILIAGILTASGIRMLSLIEFTTKRFYIVSICAVLCISLSLIDPKVLETLPSVCRYLLSSSIATSALVGIILNKVIKEDL